MKTLRQLAGLGGVLVLLGAGPASAQYQAVHHFAGGPADGANPFGSLVVVGTNFYGMTFNGGSAGLGMIFSGNSILHSFTNGPGDGANPNSGSLAISGSTLYGMTGSGGSAGNGTLFKVSTAGTGYGLLHHFAGGSGDGANPYVTPTISGATLY